MNLNELHPGTKLELELCIDSKDYLFVSEFEYIDGENCIYIAAPIYDGNIFPIHTDQIMTVYIIDKLCLYKFKAVVLGRGSKDNIILLKIKDISVVEKIQRREFYRFECSLPIKYKVIDVSGSINNESIPFKNAVTRNISGGGICLLLDEAIEANSTLECGFLLDNDIYIRFYGNVIRVYESEFRSRFRYEAAVCYEKIDNKAKEAIIGYIFEGQRKLRKKGLI